LQCIIVCIARALLQIGIFLHYSVCISEHVPGQASMYCRRFLIFEDLASLCGLIFTLIQSTFFIFFHFSSPILWVYSSIPPNSQRVSLCTCRSTSCSSATTRTIASPSFARPTARFCARLADRRTCRCVGNQQHQKLPNYDSTRTRKQSGSIISDAFHYV
jgi:hypothetical protein